MTHIESSGKKIIGDSPVQKYPINSPDYSVQMVQSAYHDTSQMDDSRRGGNTYGTRMRDSGISGSSSSGEVTCQQHGSSFRG